MKSKRIREAFTKIMTEAKKDEDVWGLPPIKVKEKPKFKPKPVPQPRPPRTVTKKPPFQRDPLDP